MPACSICGLLESRDNPLVSIRGGLVHKFCLEKATCPTCGVPVSSSNAVALPDLALIVHEKCVSETRAKKAAEIQAKVQERATMQPFRGMSDLEYKSCIDNLGLIAGEEIKLQYVCFRNTISLMPSVWDGKHRIETKKGILVFTNLNMIFMQQEAKSIYAQALRIPLEQISGVLSGGAVIKHIRIAVGVSGVAQQHEFINFVSTYGQKQIHEVRLDIEKLLKEAREIEVEKAKGIQIGVVAGDLVQQGASKVEIKDSIVQRTQIGVTTTKFNNCPYCGQPLNLPKTPVFCPFCGEKLG